MVRDFVDIAAGTEEPFARPRKDNSWRGIELSKALESGINAAIRAPLRALAGGRSIVSCTKPVSMFVRRSPSELIPEGLP